MARRPETLARIHRVRALQLTLAQGEEARARARVEGEAALTRRIAALVDQVAPAPAVALAGGGLRAAAHYRERLHRSADAAAVRVSQAEAAAHHAAAATRAARIDHGAAGKLLDRARLIDLVREMRALEDLPAAPGKRHTPC